LILRSRISAMAGLAIVLPLLVLQLSIGLCDHVLKFFGATRLGARALRVVEALSDFAHRDLGEVEMQLFVLEELHVALDDAATGIDVRAAHAARPVADTFPDVRRRAPPPRSRRIERRPHRREQFTRLALPRRIDIQPAQRCGCGIHGHAALEISDGEALLTRPLDHVLRGCVRRRAHEGDKAQCDPHWR